MGTSFDLSSPRRIRSYGHGTCLRSLHSIHVLTQSHTHGSSQTGNTNESSDTATVSEDTLCSKRKRHSTIPFADCDTKLMFVTCVTHGFTKCDKECSKLVWIHHEACRGATVEQTVIFGFAHANLTSIWKEQQLYTLQKRRVRT